MSKERLEEIEKNLDPLGYGMGGHLISVNDINWLVGYAKEHVERVQELESFKKSVEYTVDSETLELIIDNQDSDRVLSFSETYDEKIYLLQKRVQELEDVNSQLKRQAPGVELELLNMELTDALKQNKRYREALEFYAKPKNWLPQNEDVLSLITMDYGEKARKALEGKSDE